MPLCPGLQRGDVAMWRLHPYTSLSIALPEHDGSSIMQQCEHIHCCTTASAGCMHGYAASQSRDSQSRTSMSSKDALCSQPQPVTATQGQGFWTTGSQHSYKMHACGLCDGHPLVRHILGILWCLWAKKLLVRAVPCVRISAVCCSEFERAACCSVLPSCARTPVLSVCGQPYSYRNILVRVPALRVFTVWLQSGGTLADRAHRVASHVALWDEAHRTNRLQIQPYLYVQAETRSAYEPGLW